MNQKAFASEFAAFVYAVPPRTVVLLRHVQGAMRFVNSAAPASEAYELPLRIAQEEGWFEKIGPDQWRRIGVSRHSVGLQQRRLLRDRLECELQGRVWME
jgi:hypothetical protein